MTWIETSATFYPEGNVYYYLEQNRGRGSIIMLVLFFATMPTNRDMRTT